MSRLRIWPIAASALLIAAAAAFPAQPHSKTPPRSSGRPAMSDAQIEAAIRARFARSKINEDHFQVRVQGGVATLEGKTNVVQHKGVATRLAKSAGALAVNNRIQPTDAARARAAASLSKGRRRAQVRRGDARSTP